MLRLISDENFNGDIVRGLLRRHAELDIVRVQNVGLTQTPEEDILEWAAGQGRVLLSHDVSTVPPAAYRRIGDEKPMSGVFIVPDRMPIGRVIDEILFLSTDAEPDEWKEQVVFLPLYLFSLPHQDIPSTGAMRHDQAKNRPARSGHHGAHHGPENRLQGGKTHGLLHLAQAAPGTVTVPVPPRPCLPLSSAISGH
jgi:hypothetical protein